MRRGVRLDRASYIHSSLGFRSLDREGMAQFPFGQQGHQQTSGQGPRAFGVQWRHCYPHLSVTPLSAGACDWQPGPSSYHVGAQTPISVSIVPLRRTRAMCDVWLMPCALFGVATISIPSMTLRSYTWFLDSRSSYTPIPRTRVVKILNPDQKSKYVTNIWHAVVEKFQSPVALKVKTFEDKLPPCCSLDIGYFERRGSAKRWIEDQDDLDAMYRAFSPGDEITLWTHGRSQEEALNKAGKKRKRDDGQDLLSKRADKENRIDMVFQQLKELHGYAPLSML